MFRKTIFQSLAIILTLSFFCLDAKGQGINIGQQNTRTQLGQSAFKKGYYIGGITVSGVSYADPSLIILASGLEKGQNFQNLKNDPIFSAAIRKLWKDELFSNISIDIVSIKEDSVFLDIALKEHPRLGDYVITGVSKTQVSELKDKLKIVRFRMLTEAMKKNIEDAVFRYYNKKGFYNVATTFTETPDTIGNNSVLLTIHINKGNKVRINKISFAGNDHTRNEALKSKMKGTKEMPRVSLYPAEDYEVYGKEERSFKNYFQELGFLYPLKTLDQFNPYFRWNLFASSKFSPEKYDEDKKSIIAHYNSLGYRDAKIAEDTIYKIQNRNINIALKIDEGKKYYFGDIKWEGNTKYNDSTLNKWLGIQKGQTYNQKLLDARLHGGAPDGGGMENPDITSIYSDDGYLFFRINPIEISIVGDTINYLMAIQEGPQSTNKNISVSGNMKTNDYVLQREIFTLPGDKFSRTKIIRSIRQLSQLGYIDPTNIDPQLQPNYNDGTVDINYHIAEKSNDQLQLSAGFGGGTGFIGSIGIQFNNFSIKNLTNFKTWDPLPMGDGQKLSIQYQSNGLWYNSANISFTEPWLGGKKPQALTLNAVYGRYAISSNYDPNKINNWGFNGNPREHYMKYWGGGASLSQRLDWPDDNFIFSYGLNYQHYILKDFDMFGMPEFTNGKSNNLYFRLALGRNSIDQPIYPTSGSNIAFTFQFTPPYSKFSERDFTQETAQQKYRWVEYHKYRLTAEWYQKIAGKFVFKFAAKYGLLGHYNKDIGYSPFERFQVGGDGMSGFNTFIGRDLISQRGYEVYESNATIFNKYTMEVRYPFSLNPNATIFGLAFMEAGNGWQNFEVFNPFKLYRSAGLGLRVYLPMFGLLGLDYGVGFDKLGPGVKFSNAAKFTFMLGYEPD